MRWQPGALTPEAAAALRDHVAARRAGPAADEEHFRLITGFNDVFVVAAAALVLGAVGWIGAKPDLALGGAGVGLASWALAEYFTRRRRMALPSIVFLLTFVGGVFFTISHLLANDGGAGLFGRDNGAGGVHRGARRVAALVAIPGADHSGRRRGGPRGHGIRPGSPVGRRSPVDHPAGHVRCRRRRFRSGHALGPLRHSPHDAPFRCRLLAPPVGRAAPDASRLFDDRWRRRPRFGLVCRDRCGCLRDGGYRRSGNRPPRPAGVGAHLSAGGRSPVDLGIRRSRPPPCRRGAARRRNPVAAVRVLAQRPRGRRSSAARRPAPPGFPQ